jgi:hypothetical protein
MTYSPQGQGCFKNQEGNLQVSLLAARATRLLLHRNLGALDLNQSFDVNWGLEVAICGDGSMPAFSSYCASMVDFAPRPGRTANLAYAVVPRQV